jgi:Helix-turn-helix domain
LHLLDGRSWTASELAKMAKVSASTVSAHLRKLQSGELIRVSPQGRHRYFRLAGAPVARMLEALSAFAAPNTLRTPGERRAASGLRQCRLCYDHLAGVTGVAITQAMLAKQWLIESEPWFDLSPDGIRALRQLDIAVQRGKTCMDWSERRLHLAGELGAHLASQFLARDWLRRHDKSRALWLTPSGEQALQQYFGLHLALPHAA